MKMLELQNFINGKFLPSSAFVDSFDPSRGEVYAQVPRSGKAEVEQAVLAAEDAAKGYVRRFLSTSSGFRGTRGL